MDIFAVLSFLGGLALFLYGMKTMGSGLKAMAGGRLEGLIAKLCSTTWRGVLVGAAATAAIQSSSATTVMVIGFVNSGIMKLSAAVGVIMGANLGTTVTSWILSLTGIEGDNVFVRLLKPSSLAPLLALTGVVLIMRRGRGAGKSVGAILAGLGILFFGMEMMSTAVKPLAEIPEFTGLLTLFSNPLAGLLAGIVLTSIVQSSSAAVGILQALTLSGGVSYAAALPIVMGQNIGTCVTALISSIGASKNAKRAAFVHLYFNVIGTAVLMALFYGLNAIVKFSFVAQAADPAGIAVIHTAFNVLATFILLPFAQLLRRLAELTVREKKPEKSAAGGASGEYGLLDERFLRFPATALYLSQTAFGRMLELARDNFSLAAEQFGKFNETRSKTVAINENIIDAYQDDLSSYMIKLSALNLGRNESAGLTKMMYDIGDIERIGDHAEGLDGVCAGLRGDGVTLSEQATRECGTLIGAVSELLDNTVNAVLNNDSEAAHDAEPLREVVDALRDEMKARHIERLKRGECISAAPLFDQLLTDCSRVADHCSNLAVSVIRLREERLDAHGYLRRIRLGDEHFTKRYSEYRAKYGI